MLKWLIVEIAVVVGLKQGKPWQESIARASAEVQQIGCDQRLTSSIQSNDEFGDYAGIDLIEYH